MSTEPKSLEALAEEMSNMLRVEKKPFVQVGIEWMGRWVGCLNEHLDARPAPPEWCTVCLRGGVFQCTCARPASDLERRLRALAAFLRKCFHEESELDAALLLEGADALAVLREDAVVAKELAEFQDRSIQEKLARIADLERELAETKTQLERWQRRDNEGRVQLAELERELAAARAYAAEMSDALQTKHRALRAAEARLAAVRDCFDCEHGDDAGAVLEAISKAIAAPAQEPELGAPG